MKRNIIKNKLRENINEYDRLGIESDEEWKEKRDSITNLFNSTMDNIENDNYEEAISDLNHLIGMFDKMQEKLRGFKN